MARTSRGSSTVAVPLRALNRKDLRDTASVPVTLRYKLSLPCACFRSNLEISNAHVTVWRQVGSSTVPIIHIINKNKYMYITDMYTYTLITEMYTLFPANLQALILIRQTRWFTKRM